LPISAISSDTSFFATRKNSSDIYGSVGLSRPDINRSGNQLASMHSED
jgi:hypothetical protein